VIAGADELGLEVRTPRARRERGGVVNVRVGDDAETICHRLLERGVCTDHRGDGLRISPHFFTLEDDVDRLFTELAPMLVGRGRPR
jgi:selenocysteine lyase/cysteine desulfurase